MRTFAELKRARAWASQEFGDPAAPVFHLFFRWHEGSGQDYAGEDLIASMWGGKFALWLAPQWPVTMPVVVGEAQIRVVRSMAMNTWGSERLGPGVWALSPSLNMPGVVHAYIIVTDVPEPTPWASTVAPPTT
jgi:hypothetical protein